MNYPTRPISSRTLARLAMRRCFLWLRTAIHFCLLAFFALPHLANANSELTVDIEDKLEINRIKSAYLYNFLKYIDLKQPEKSIQKDFAVCVLGTDPFGIALDAMSGRTAKGVNVLVKRVSKVEQAVDCNIVYISQSEENQLSKIIQSFNSFSILTVSDIKNFTREGGIIGFITDDKRIGIEINLKNAQKANIKISALLLEIAKITE